MEYTIQNLARIAGVSTRTLRYYDQIGLLSPARISSGYRIYKDQEVDRLQQILFYRELKLGLSEIKKIIDAKDYDPISALESHLDALQEQKQRLEQLIRTLEKTIKYKRGEKMMSDMEKFEGFKKELVEENEKKYGEEIREKYGKEIVDRSNAKMMGLTKEQYDAMQELGSQIINKLEEAVKNGASPAGQEGMEIAKLHKQWLSYTWPSYSKEAHMGLTDMYMADERFSGYYDSRVSGCAKFLRDAVYNMTE